MQKNYGKEKSEKVFNNLVQLVKIQDAWEAPLILHELLRERDSSINISHKDLPSIEDHMRFLRSEPYRVWNLVKVKDNYVGSIYLSKANEIGVFILKKYRGNGYGVSAIKKLMAENKVPRWWLANVNPKNKTSEKIFVGLGFKHIQNTYALTAVSNESDIEDGDAAN